MKMTQRKKRQAGFAVTAELLLVSTILVLGLITGWTKLRDQTLAELSDTGSAIGAINQSYTMQGTNWANIGVVAQVSGFAYSDNPDPLTIGQVGGDNSHVLYMAAPSPSTTGLGVAENGINQGIVP